jgi:selenocysteine-specific translation elongation factor
MSQRIQVISCHFYQVFIFAGTKSDLLSKEQLSKKSEIMKQFVNSMNSTYFITSSKENSGIDEMFLSICKKLMKEFENVESTPKDKRLQLDGSNISEEKQEPSGCNC